MTCCVPRCNFSNLCRKTDDPSVTFHEFPCDPNVAAKWIRNINVSMPNGGKWYPKSDDKVCSNHFLPSDFKLNVKRRTLKPSSVPTVFETVANSLVPLLPSSNKRKQEETTPTSPMIVKVDKPAFNNGILHRGTNSATQVRPILPNLPSTLGGKSVIFVPAHLLPPGASPVSARIVSQGLAASSPQLVPQVLSFTSPQPTAQIKPSPASKSATSSLKTSSNVQVPRALSPCALSPNEIQKSLTSATQNSFFKPVVSKSLPSISTTTSNTSNSQFSRSTLSTNIGTTNMMQKSIKDKVPSSSSRINASTSISSKQVSSAATTKSVEQEQSSETSMDLIEIGPSTFLKINPDVIKVTKKVTPSGNTVLQFVMNPNVAGVDVSKAFQTGVKVPSKKLPFQKPGILPSKKAGNNKEQETSITSSGPVSDAGKSVFSNTIAREESVTSTENVDVIDLEEDDMAPDTTSENAEMVPTPENAPVLLSTSLPVKHQMHIWNEKQERYAKTVKEKSRIICNLRSRICKLTKRVEELENKCIVQERQLNFTSLKKLRAIKKNAENGEPHATFILEQIRGYFPNVTLRWSPSTMNQCSVWCRKAPYAYEYFKKADLFRLPAIATVKRYMKNHPEVATQIKNRTLGVRTFDSDESSSDFDFDESDDENREGNVETQEVVMDYVPCETVLGQSQESRDGSYARVRPSSNTQLSEEEQNVVAGNGEHILPDNQTEGKGEGHIAENVTESNQVEREEPMDTDVSGYVEASNDIEGGTVVEATLSEETVNINGGASGIEVVQDVSEVPANEAAVDYESRTICLPSTTNEDGVTTVNFNGQELVLQPGSNIIQLNSEPGEDGQFESQYIVIPSADDQSGSEDQQFGTGQPISFVIQNGEDETQQIIYITDATNVAENVSVTLSS